MEANKMTSDKFAGTFRRGGTTGRSKNGHGEVKFRSRSH